MKEVVNKEDENEDDVGENEDDVMRIKMML